MLVFPLSSWFAVCVCVYMFDVFFLVQGFQSWVVLVRGFPRAIVLKSRFGWFGENHMIAFI